MDPKSLANLDPKLRETYERVMGTTTQVNTASTEDTHSDPSSEAPTLLNETTTSLPELPDLPLPASPDGHLSSLLGPPNQAPNDEPKIELSATPNTPEDLGLSPSTSQRQSAFFSENPSMEPFASPSTVTKNTEGVSTMQKALYITGGSIFLLAYVFFWVKIFNYKLPF